MDRDGIDIVRGQLVSMYGYDCIVRSVDEYGADLEYPNGEIRWEDFDDIAVQNEDLVIDERFDCDEDDW